jgi:HK97 gp10 family phage protein
MIGFEGQIEGADELRKQLDAMGPAGKKLMRRALRDGAKVTAAQMRQDAPNVTGATEEAIKVMAGKRSRSRMTMMVAIGAGWFKGDTFYAAFVNFGHKVGKRLSRGKGAAISDTRQSIPGTFWINNAFRKSAAAAVDAITATVKSGLAAMAKGKADGDGGDE